MNSLESIFNRQVLSKALPIRSEVAHTLNAEYTLLPSACRLREASRHNISFVPASIRTLAAHRSTLNHLIQWEGIAQKSNHSMGEEIALASSFQTWVGDPKWGPQINLWGPQMVSLMSFLLTFSQIIQHPV